MAEQPRKLSEIMKEMSEMLLRNPGGVPSSEAAHVALLFANIAWNESVGLDHARQGYRNAWETIEAENPALWNEFKSDDIDAMIDELIVRAGANGAEGHGHPLSARDEVHDPQGGGAKSQAGCRRIGNEVGSLK